MSIKDKTTISTHSNPNPGAGNRGEEAGQRSVIGIGETVLDIIFQGNKPVDAVPGGSCFNSIISLSRTGIKTQFISETANDRVGGLTMDFLAKNGVDSSLVNVRDDIKSPLSLAFLNERNDAEYVFYKDHSASRLSRLRPTVRPNDIVLFSSYFALNPAIRAEVSDFLHYAKDQGAILYYDVNFRSSHAAERDALLENMEENFRLADILRGSDEDFRVIFGIEGIEEVFRKHLAASLFSYGHAATFIYTRGPQPVQVIVANPPSADMKTDAMPSVFKCYEAPSSVSATSFTPVSTIGAGDNFNAGFAYGLIREGITREQIHASLNETQICRLIHYAEQFAIACCSSIYNYVPEGFLPND
ncbi:MAG: carbohydrate kinase [Bacteroidaceae bacterium]|nr:carbohydrate kinase [Bacteroidaceae bacterium]